MDKISIIVCTRNRADFLLGTLEILEGVLPQERAGIEVIVVDNGSTDNTREGRRKFSAAHREFKLYPSRNGVNRWH